jgi:hypothetical protein
MSTFKEDLTNDLEIFLNSDEFAVDVTYLGDTIQGIFDDEFSSAVQGEMGVESTVPQVLVRTSDVPNVAHSQEMTINSTVYKVIGIQPDGTGMTLLLLSKD